MGLLPILAFYPDLMRDMVLYGVLRLALWAVIWWLLTVAGMGVILAGVLAALIAMLISILALNRLRDSAAMRWKEADDRRRERKGQRLDEDAAEEDALLDEDDAEDEAPLEDDGVGGQSTPQQDAEPEAPGTGPADLPSSPSDEDGQDPLTPPDR